MRTVKFFKVPDILLLFLLVMAPLYAVLTRTPLAPQEPVAVVEIAGVPRYSIPLDKAQEIRLREWNPPVVLKTLPGKIRILQNNCNKQICVRTGYIDKTDELIVCVPKKILIYIQQGKNEQQNSDIKAITG